MERYIVTPLHSMHDTLRTHPWTLW